MFEGNVVEFKREYTDDIKYTVIAFANTDGGKIYLGINNDGSVCGVSNVDDTMLRVTNMVRDTVRPDVTMFMNCNVDVMDGKQIVVVTIQRGTARPYYLHGKGVRPEGVYVRQGSSSVPASEAAILRMIKETSNDSYEDERSLNQELTFEKTAEYFAQKGLGFGDAQKRTLNIIGTDGTYTNLGMLLSDQCVHTVKLAVFEGSNKIVFKDRKELSGSLFEQLEGAFSYIDNFNRTRAEFAGLYRIDTRDYPTEALREALLNAIVHKDYGFSASILISIFDNRIEIVTVGGLVHGITFDDIMLGVSALRNQHLANVFYRLKLIEAYGTGLLKINEAYSEHYVKPRIEVTDNAFKITLPNVNFEKEGRVVSEAHTGQQQFINNVTRKKLILNLFKTKQEITRKDIQDALKVSQATAILVARDLVERGVLEKVGNGRMLRYRLTQK